MSEELEKMDEEKEYEDAMKMAPWHQEHKTITEIKTLKPNSFMFRWGSTGTEIKCYYETAEDLENQLKELDSRGSAIKAYIQGIKTTLKEVA